MSRLRAVTPLCLLVPLALGLYGCGARAGGTGSTPTPEGTGAAAASEPVCLVGDFTIVRNGSTRYYLHVGDGRNLELVIDEETVRELGGMARFDRARVTVLASPVEAIADTFRVLEMTDRADSNLCEERP